MNKNFKINTSRLYLRPLRVSDAEAVFAWVGDDEVTKYLTFSTYRSVSDVETWIQSKQDDPTLWGICLGDGKLIGSISCAPVQNLPNYTLGYCLRKDFWGKGYCTEAALALIAYTAESTGVREFSVMHAVQNVGSQRVIEKCGFVFDGYGSYDKRDGLQTFSCKKYTLRVGLHRMNLDEAPYESIVRGQKTVELRLNDERRQGIAVGDFVTLSHGSDKIVVKVLKLHRFADFRELYSKLDLTKCGYTKEHLPFARWEDMLQYYPAEKQRQYGALGIEFKLLALFSDRF